MREGRGSFIDGEFVDGAGATITSVDPANSFTPVYSTPSDKAHVTAAVNGARAAFEAWSAKTLDDRVEHLRKLQAVFDEMVDEVADAIVSETGKPLREAKGEAKALGARVELTATAGRERIQVRRPSGVRGEERFHAQGVLAVLGPYNYPAHLVNAHVIPALMTGNTVIVKPSEHASWTGELYAEAARRAGLPPGVVQVLPGGPDVGRALVTDHGVDGVLFTGSYRTGRAITEECLDQPHKLLALEMGGKNAAVVLDDADLPQALAGILQGAFLSAGQRCTATSRVLLHRAIADKLQAAITDGASKLRPGDPRDPASPFGPLANKVAFDRFQRLRADAPLTGAEPLVPGEALPGGAFVTPSVHRLPDGVTEAPGYLDEELFGPDICIEVIEDDDDAIERLRASNYGLSNAVFTADDARFERFYRRVKSGLLNRNRSTNGASGKLPFGGVGRSGNQRPAGVAAVGYTTYPVAVMSEDMGHYAVESAFQGATQGALEELGAKAADPTLIPDLAPEHLAARHDVEAALERHRIPVDAVRGAVVVVAASEIARALASHLGDAVTEVNGGLEITVPAGGLDLDDALRAAAEAHPEHVLARPSLAVHRPAGGRLPRSAALLARMYAGDFVPRERKPAIVDHTRSEGPFLCSVDESPLTILDAASQIASLGHGFAPGVFFRALDEGELGPLLVANPDTTAAEDDATAEYARFLLGHAGGHLAHATFASGGAEANERAFDLCRLNGPGGRKVIAFEGSFHGRTLAALHATYNPVKRKAFELEGYEAAFAPFPAWDDPRHEPDVDDAWIQSCHDGEPALASDDPLARAEVESLVAVRELIRAGDVCCVIAEPMQGEGGDRFCTARYMNGLRALTRGAGVPLVYDEVQSGLGLSGDLFWHHRFSLRDKDGAPDGPDCVTLAKKAQLGVCLSRWEDPRPAPAHAAQALRGLLHAREALEHDPHNITARVRLKLARLAYRFPSLVENPRAVGYSFAFDLPSKHQANQLIAQRFYRGYMAYIAGERTVRFRLNTAWTDAHVDTLMTALGNALAALKRGGPTWTAPAWIDPARPDNGAPAVHVPERPYGWLKNLSVFARERAADRVLVALGREPDAHAVRAAFTELDVGPDPTPSAVLAALEARGGATAELELPAHVVLAAAYASRIVTITPDEWGQWRDGVLAIENATYEDGRRETEDELRAMVEGEGGIGLLAVRRTETGRAVMGYAFGGPVTNFRADGPRTDPLASATFYSSNITVHADARGSGLGVRLKRAQVEAVLARKGQDGAARYRFMSGRNRVGHTQDMSRVNRAFGSYVVEHFRGGQYGDLSGEAVYYRQPVRAPLCPGALRPDSSASQSSKPIDWASGVQAPLGPRPERLVRALERGDMRGAVGTKLTLSNFISADVVRYAELLRALAPKDLPHAFFTSGRDELVDKGLRALRVQRPEGRVLLGFERQFLGTTTAAARSLTDPAGHAVPFGWYDWPRLPHPAEVGPDAAAGALLAAVQQAGPEKILGVVVEVCGERSGLSLDEQTLEALFAVRKDTGVPVVAVETASALGRTGPTLWGSDAWAERPDHAWWYAGAQLGHIFTSDAMFVAKPLTLISTWDGDELSMHRARAHLLEARAHLVDDRRDRFAAATKARFPEARGAGLLQAVPTGAPVDVAAACKAAGLLVQPGYGAVVLTPSLLSDDDEWTRGLDLLAAATGKR
jgi:succinylglutamate-semialdehyde dehydrogenase